MAASNKTKHNQNGEKERQMVMNILLNEPTLTFNEMAAKCGMSRDRFYQIRTSEGFYEEYHKHCQERFRAIEETAVRKLYELCEQGNFQAIKYVLDGLDYAAAQKVDVTANNIRITIGGDEDDE